MSNFHCGNPGIEFGDEKEKEKRKNSARPNYELCCARRCFQHHRGYSAHMLQIKLSIISRWCVRIHASGIPHTGDAFAGNARKARGKCREWKRVGLLISLKLPGDSYIRGFLSTASRNVASGETF